MIERNRSSSASIPAWLAAILLAAPPGHVIAEEKKPLDIRDPGADLANFPNSAFTLPRGGFYLEMAPAFFSAESSRLSAQYNWEYMLRYGLFDAVELRLYSQGFSVQGSPNSATGFSPLTLDTKIHLWDEIEAYFLPAAGLEVMVQTTWLGSSAFDAGTEPSFSFNFDQGLPWWDVDLEYNLGAARFQDPDDPTDQVWDFTLSWALQRDVVEDVAVFVNGYHNSSNLPRIGRLADKYVRVCPHSGPCRTEELVQQYSDSAQNYVQHMIGGGTLWTVDDHIAVFGNIGVGLTSSTPPVTAYFGFAWTP